MCKFSEEVIGGRKSSGLSNVVRKRAIDGGRSLENKITPQNLEICALGGGFIF